MPQSTLAELGAKLTQLEKQVELIGRKLGPQALDMLPLLDEAHVLLARVQAEGNPAPAEAGRLEAILTRFDRKAVAFLHEIGGRSALQKARAARRPEPAQWWWCLDQRLGARRKASVRRLLIWGAGIAAAIAVLVLVYNRFLAPPPAVVARQAHESAANDAVAAQDWAGALREVEQALTFDPGSSDLLVFKGIVLLQLGQTADAETAFAAAKQSLGSEDVFLTTRGEKYLALGRLDQARADAQGAVQANPQSAAAYLLLGKVDQSLGRNSEALAEYDQASKLADAQGNTLLVALARVQAAYLTQQMGLMPLATPSPDPALP